jgi:spore coat polysaccharide biosynthesis protein SpsF
VKSVAIIQARMRSQRLPAKVMLDLCGRTILAHVVSRVQACKAVDQVVVATTENEIEKAIVAEATSLGVEVCRGSENDVLGRYYKAAKKFNAEIIIRVTSDCPLFDPELLSLMLSEFESMALSGFKRVYFSNSRIRTYPRGLDAEVFNMPALELANKEAKLGFEREHVTPYMFQHPDKFLLYDFRGDEDLSKYRWTLDTPEDFKFFEAIYSELYKEGEIISTEDVLGLLSRRPELCKLNEHIRQKQIQ